MNETHSVEITNDPTDCKVIIDQLVEAIQGPDKRAASRELSLAVTNLQQARMWINEHQKLA